MDRDEQWYTNRRSAWALMAGAAWVATEAQAQGASAPKDAGAPVNVQDFMSPEQRRRVQERTAPGDCTAAFMAAFQSGATPVQVPAGRFPIQPGLQVPNNVCLVGQGYGLLPGMGGTVLVKSGNGPALVVGGAAQVRQLSIEGAPGNQGDGLLVLGGRSLVQDVSVFGQGRDGIKVGDASSSTANTNLWRLTTVISRQNGRHGLFVAHEGARQRPNANAGLLNGIDASHNGGDGVRVSEAVDNQFIGVAAQSNAGGGVVLEALAIGNVLLAPYCEANGGGDIRLAPGADRNMVLGVRSGLINSGVANQGADNVIWGRYGSVRSVPLHEGPEAFESLEILERGGSGVWRLRKLPGSRQLAIELAATGQGADVLLHSEGAGSSGLRFANDTHSAALRDLRARVGVAVNIDALPPGGTVDVPFALSGADARSVFLATPQFQPAPGLCWNVYWDAAGATPRLRCVNAGPGLISVRGAFQVASVKLS